MIEDSPEIDSNLVGNSGALVILGLFVNRWTAEDCLKHFQALSTVAFRKRRYLGPSVDVDWGASEMSGSPHVICNGQQVQLNWYHQCSEDCIWRYLSII